MTKFHVAEHRGTCHVPDTFRPDDFERRCVASRAFDGSLCARTHVYAHLDVPTQYLLTQICRGMPHVCVCMCVMRQQTPRLYPHARDARRSVKRERKREKKENTHPDVRRFTAFKQAEWSPTEFACYDTS